MKFFSLLLKENYNSIIIYFLVLLHFFGGVFANFAILATSVIMVYMIIFIKKIDLFLIFLLLSPTIIFSSESNLNSVSGLSFFMKDFKNTLFLGPFALTTSFAMVLALPVRLLIDFSVSRNKGFIIIWIVNLLFAIAGLIISIFSDVSNPSGLTVGLRIALTLGISLIAYSNIDRDSFFKSLDKIVLLSFLLLVLGLIKTHWLFITFGFVPYFYHRINPRIFAILPLIYSFSTLFKLGNTFTILAILFFSILFYVLIAYNKTTRSWLEMRYVILLLLLLPLIVTFYTLALKKTGRYDFSTFKGKIEFKLLGDRKPIWDASWKDIWTSNLFLKPSGGHLSVYFDYIKKWENWTAGTHNIYLEIGRQVGAFSMITLSAIMIIILYRVGGSLKILVDTITFYCLLSVFLIFGLTGQSLVYDGVGALFWMIVGQFGNVLDSKQNLNNEVQNFKSPIGTILKL